MTLDHGSARKGALKSSAFRIASIYAIVGSLWILFSDMFVTRLNLPTHTTGIVMTLKGWLFIAVTMAILYVLIERTISSIRRSEQELIESKRTLSTLLENLPGMAYSIRNDEHQTVEFISSSCLDLTGYSPRELTNRDTFTRVVHPDDRKYVRDAVDSAVREMRPYRMVYRIVTASGEEKWVWQQGVGVFSPDGELQSLEGFISDITERKHAEDALRESEERYRALVEGTSDAILMLDAERHIVSVNQAFLDLFGYERGQLRGKSSRVLYPSEEGYTNFARMAFPVLRTRGPFRAEWQMIKKDGSVFPIEGSFSATTSPDGEITAYIGIVRDITERKQAEAELRRYREQLEEMVIERTRELKAAEKALVQREKLKTLGAISAEVAHEIRNPLVSIGGFARRLHRKMPDSPETSIILNESRRLESILDRISNYLKPVEMRPRELSVNCIITECLQLLSPELTRENARVELDLDPVLPNAYADPDILSQVLIDIIRSSLGVMDRTRPLVMKSYDGDPSLFVDLKSCVTHGRRLKDPELLFLPFDEGGTSIGVSLSFKLLRGMGGHLTVVQDDEFITFTLALPKTPEAESYGVYSIG